jgi:hypothetical protein
MKAIGFRTARLAPSSQTGVSSSRGGFNAVGARARIARFTVLAELCVFLSFFVAPAFGAAFAILWTMSHGALLELATEADAVAPTVLDRILPWAYMRAKCPPIGDTLFSFFCIPSRCRIPLPLPPFAHLPPLPLPPPEPMTRSRR